MPATDVQQSPMMTKIIATIGELPTSPAVVSTVMGLTADLNTEIDKLSRVLSGDPALTAKVLRLSNSPFYGRARSVASLNEAVLILGFHTIRSLVVASSTYSLFGRKSGNETAGILWDHSLATAMAARIIAQRIRHKQIEECFIVGLLHDIGKLILLQKMPTPYQEIVKQVKADHLDFNLLEEQKLGFTHSALGAVILSLWNFPPALVDTVANHHSNEAFVSEDGNVSLVAIVSFANELAKNLGTGFIEDYQKDLTALPQALAMDLDAAMIASIQEEIETRFNEEKHLFEG